MFVVTEAQAAMIRATYEQRGVGSVSLHGLITWPRNVAQLFDRGRIQRHTLGLNLFL
jgi:hypothetical protein